MAGLFVLSSFTAAFIPTLILGLTAGLILAAATSRAMRRNGLEHSFILGLAGGIIGLFTGFALIAGEAGEYSSPPDSEVFTTTFMMGLYTGLLPAIVLAGGSFVRILAILRHKSMEIPDTAE